MAKYVDGFVIVVPKDKAQEYKEMAEGGRDSWMKHGALAYYECRGDDLVPQEMGGQKARAFTEMAGATNEYYVWFVTCYPYLELSKARLRTFLNQLI